MSNVSTVPGVNATAPSGYVISNLDPNFNSTLNSEIYDPNFLPGFQAGLTNTSVTWVAGPGFGRVGYAVGPWASLESSGIPHLAIGPQCCNFAEVPHTQQFRRVEWGDFYFVRAGLGQPGVNVDNYTTNFTAPAYVGLRTDWDWRVQFSLYWNPPFLVSPRNEWGAIGISATQYVPEAPGKLVSTLVNLWMDANSSSTIIPSTDGVGRRIGSDVVTYHPVQIVDVGNMTVTIDLSPYLADTLGVLGLQTSQGQPPVISYVYLNVEGYNFEWNTTLWSFNLISKGSNPPTSLAPLALSLLIAGPIVALLVFAVAKRKSGFFLRRDRVEQ